MKKLIPLCLMAVCWLTPATAHQAPYSIVYLDVSPDRVGVELQIPLSELQLAFGNTPIGDPETLIQRIRPQLTEYIMAHTHAFVRREDPWLVEIRDMYTDKEEQILSGPAFYELRVRLVLLPQHNEGTRHFMLDYDAVVHQVVNHIIFVAVRSDWETGRSDSLTAGSNPMTIRTAGDNKVYPLAISIEKGTWFTGVRNMFSLGMEHIKEGTDHLLFLIALLFPAMLIPQRRRWGAYAGLKPSLGKILRIVTAFTIGHSLTLLIGALGWLRLPAPPVEICIAVSILVSAVHAMYPLFPGKEMLVAAGFGLVHGLAFAGVISQLNLGAGTLAAGIFGFNLGIEVMQLIVILLIIPWLILLSQTGIYRYIRIGGAAFAGIAAIGWIIERVTGKDNFIGQFAGRLSTAGIWVAIGLCILSISLYLWSRWRLKHTAAWKMNIAYKN